MILERITLGRDHRVATLTWRVIEADAVEAAEEVVAAATTIIRASEAVEEEEGKPPGAAEAAAGGPSIPRTRRMCSGKIS